MKKIQYEVEFSLRTSPKLIYNRISTPSGLSEWFADKVTYTNKNFSFEWNGNIQEAKVLAKKANEFIKLQWIDEDEDEYFEFKITKDELTNEVSIVITDFAYEDEIEDSRKLWDQQISELKRALGL